MEVQKMHEGAKELPSDGLEPAAVQKVGSSRSGCYVNQNQDHDLPGASTASPEV